MVDEHRRDQAIGHDKFLDDEYQEQYYRERKKELENPLRVSDCCEAPITNFREDGYRDICTKCHDVCQAV